MKKNGFVFVESIVVLVVVALSLAMMISSYSLISRKTKEKEYYNRASDKYLLYSIASVGTDDICNYGIGCNSSIGRNVNFHATPSNCVNTKMGKILYQCSEVLNELRVSDIYVVDDISKELKTNYNIKDADGTQYYKNGVIEYMKTLKKCNDANNSNVINGYASNLPDCSSPIKYMIGVFKRGNDDYYYAAIEL